jgi:hypothetical protein
LDLGKGFEDEARGMLQPRTCGPEAHRGIVVASILIERCGGNHGLLKVVRMPVHGTV